MTLTRALDDLLQRRLVHAPRLHAAVTLLLPPTGPHSIAWGQRHAPAAGTRNRMQRLGDGPGVTRLFTPPQEHGEHYYWNKVTGKTQWQKPAELAWKRVPVQDESDEL